jgi:hypothetical protein
MEYVDDFILFNHIMIKTYSITWRICLKVYNISIKDVMFISNLHHLIIFWPHDPQRFGCLEGQSEQHRPPVVKMNILVA